VKARPILFSTQMVRALLASTKTQSRRVVKLPADAREVKYWTTPTGRSQVGYADPCVNYWTKRGNHIDACPYGQPGDRLWVRETWRTRATLDDYCPREIERRCLYAGFPQGPACPLHYAADGRMTVWGDNDTEDFGEWGKMRSSIHMPRWASRITLEITRVRVERLQEISEEDARAEGVERDTEPCDHSRRSCEEIGCLGPTHRASYCALWEEIHGPGSWGANPWVWVLEFKISGHRSVDHGEAVK